MSLTTSPRLANCGSLVAVIAAAAMPECSSERRKWALEIATDKKYGVAAHSRFAGQELDLICNHKFV